MTDNKPLKVRQKFRIKNINGVIVPKNIYGEIYRVVDSGRVVLIGTGDDPNIYTVELKEYIDDELTSKNEDKVMEKFEVGRKLFNELEKIGDIIYYTDEEFNSLYFKPIPVFSRLDSVDFED